MKFNLIFDGAALENHEINPKDLSIALLAIDELIREANAILNYGRAGIEIKIKGSFETGSFKINFILSLFDKIKDLLSNHEGSILAAKEILKYLFKVIELIKHLKGGKPDKIFENGDGTLHIFKDAKELKTEKGVYELYKSYKLRKNFENLVSPVRERDGIDDVAITYDENEHFCMITKDEAHYFKCPEPEKEKIDKESIFETSLNIINLSFKEGNKWFVDDGQSTFFSTVEDEEFLQKINNNQVSFAKGDILRVKIRREQFYNLTESKLRAEHFIIKVLDHRKPPVNMNLFG